VCASESIPAARDSIYTFFHKPRQTHTPRSTTEECGFKYSYEILRDRGLGEVC
jgi:hypothetical protein